MYAREEIMDCTIRISGSSIPRGSSGQSALPAQTPATMLILNLLYRAMMQSRSPQEVAAILSEAFHLREQLIKQFTSLIPPRTHGIIEHHLKAQPEVLRLRLHWKKDFLLVQ